MQQKKWRLEKQVNDVAIWQPSLFTHPLTEDFKTDGDKLLKVIDMAWKSPEAEEFELDEWQRWLIRHVLERYPADHPKYPNQLRYRQVLISMGRQNGKSVLGAVFALYGLLTHSKGPEVISVASTVPQAEIIYKRVKYVIDNNPSLKKMFKTTGTRGIVSRNEHKPGTYMVKAGAEDALQGITISLCLYDEVHITKPETWNAVVFGTSARENGMVLGITTAGDDKSELLKRLYKTGKSAAIQEADHDERFGFFLWEAPEHLEVTDREALIAANPSIACGRMDIDQEINAIKNMPENQARRYRLNQFVASEASWLPMTLWNRLEVSPIPSECKHLVFAVDRAENWEYATITAATKHKGKVYTEVVASLTNPTIESLEALCMDIWRKHKGLGFVMEQINLRDLAYRLRERGVQIEYLTQTQMMNVCAVAFSLISEGKIVHAGDDLLRRQMPKGVSKNIGEGWRISRRESVGEIDSLLATVMSIYAAETMKPRSPMIYIG